MFFSDILSGCMHVHCSASCRTWRAAGTQEFPNAKTSVTCYVGAELIYSLGSKELGLIMYMKKKREEETQKV